MELYLDVGFKAAGRLVTRRKRNVLSGEDSNGEMEGFAGNGADNFFVVAVGSIAWIRLAICNMSRQDDSYLVASGHILLCPQTGPR